MSFGKSQRNDLLRMALTLFAIAAIVGVLLALANYVTEPIIARSGEERLEQSLNALMADAATFEEVEDFTESITLGNTKISVASVYAARTADGQKMGYCVEVTPAGYSDIIDMMVAIDGEGAVCGVQILSISDTPGIGMKVQTNEEFQRSVYGLTDAAKVVKTTPTSPNELQAISGATVSSTAYINGVNAALEVAQLLEQEVQK